jgi:hypothetical protein
MTILEFEKFKELEKEVNDFKSLKIPWWDTTSSDASKKLWMPNNTIECGKINSFIKISQLSSGGPITDFKFNMDPNIMEADAQSVVRMFSVQIYPTPGQAKLFKNCFDVSRYIYNKCVEVFRREKDKKEKITTNFMKLRNFVLGQPKVQYKRYV